MCKLCTRHVLHVYKFGCGADLRQSRRVQTRMAGSRAYLSGHVRRRVLISTGVTKRLYGHVLHVQKFVPSTSHMYVNLVTGRTSDRATEGRLEGLESAPSVLRALHLQRLVYRKLRGVYVSVSYIANIRHRLVCCKYTSASRILQIYVIVAYIEKAGRIRERLVYQKLRGVYASVSYIGNCGSYTRLQPASSSSSSLLLSSLDQHSRKGYGQPSVLPPPI